MVRFGNFEVEYNRNAPDKVSVRIETDDKGEVWLPKCDIARAYGVFVSLATIIALGFRMKGLKCEAFRKWAARRLAESFEKKKSTVILCMSGEKRNSWN